MKKTFILPCKTVLYGVAVIEAESKKEAIELIEAYGITDFDMLDNKCDYEYDIEDLEEE